MKKYIFILFIILFTASDSLWACAESLMPQNQMDDKIHIQRDILREFGPRSQDILSKASLIAYASGSQTVNVNHIILATMTRVESLNGRTNRLNEIYLIDYTHHFYNFALILKELNILKRVQELLLSQLDVQTRNSISTEKHNNDLLVLHFGDLFFIPTLPYDESAKALLERTIVEKKDGILYRWNLGNKIFFVPTFDENLFLVASKMNTVIREVLNENEVFKLSKVLLKDIEEGQIEIVKEMLKQGIPPDIQDENGKAPLMQAVSSGQIEIAKFLLANGADVNLQAKDGTTALMQAVSQHHTELVKLLLGAGADVNLQDNRGRTALMLANAENTKLLLEAGAKVNLQAKDGTTALMMAAFDAKLLMLLLKNGADPDIQDDLGRTVLMIISRREGHEGNLMLLLTKEGADVNIQDKEGITALHFATLNNFTTYVNILLAIDADPNLQAKDGTTALHLACRYSRPKIVKQLLDNGADPDIQDMGGNTPLIWASLYGHLNSVKALLEAGANIHIQNHGLHLTALSIARENGHTKIVNLLRKTEIIQRMIDEGYTESANLLKDANFTRDIGGEIPEFTAPEIIKLLRDAGFTEQAQHEHWQNH